MTLKLILQKFYTLRVLVAQKNVDLVHVNQSFFFPVLVQQEDDGHKIRRWRGNYWADLLVKRKSFESRNSC